MPSPEYLIPVSSRTRGGSLLSSDLDLIRSKLLHGGFVLLPSDTCYSIAMIPRTNYSRVFLNAIFDRPERRPISIAFPSIGAVREYLDIPIAAVRLLERFTPGPITVVTEIMTQTDSSRVLVEGAGALDGTVGIRIPDSAIEREVAGCTQYPVTSVAVRDDHGTHIRCFREAVEVVRIGTYFAGGSGWYAIEGDDASFYDQHSTVVRLVDSNSIALLRKGPIPIEDVRETLQLPSSAEFEDEG